MSSLTVWNPSPIMGALCVVFFMAHETFLHWVHFQCMSFPANTERVWTPWLSPLRFFIAFSSALSPPTCLCASNWSTLLITFDWPCTYLFSVSTPSTELVHIVVLLVGCPSLPLSVLVTPTLWGAHRWVFVLLSGWCLAWRFQQMLKMSKFGTGAGTAGSQILTARQQLCMHVSGPRSHLA